MAQKVNGDQLGNTAGAWTIYTPTVANLTIGNGTLVAKYRQVGKTVYVRIHFTLGSTSSIGTAPTISLPTTAASIYSTGAAGHSRIGSGCVVDAGVAIYDIFPNIVTSTTVLTLYCINTSFTYALATPMTSTAPTSLATSDALMVQAEYEAA